MKRFNFKLKNVLLMGMLTILLSFSIIHGASAKMFGSETTCRPSGFGYDWCCTTSYFFWIPSTSCDAAAPSLSVY